MFYLMVFLMFYSTDFFADDLEIPTTIKFEKPKDEIDTLTFRKENTFEIKNGSQPGIYEILRLVQTYRKGKNIFESI